MKNTILFMGSDTQTGTTMLALSAAEELARTGKRVLYIGSGFCAGDEYLPRNLPAASDNLLAGLLTGNLTEADLQTAAVNCRGVDILTGIRLNQQGYCFLPGELLAICTMAEKLWDWVVIDGGIVLGNSSAAAVMEHAGQIWIVATQQEKSISRYQRWNSAGNLNFRKAVRYVLNKYNDSGAFYTIKEMAEILNCTEKEIVPVPYVPYGWQAEEEHTTLLNFRRFRKAVRSLINCIEKGGCDGTDTGSSL